MEQFENQLPQEQSAPQEDPVQEAPRNPMPFADSPYQSCIPPQPEPPQKPKKARSASRNPWKRAVACVAAVLLVAASSGATALVLNSRWENRMETVVLALSQRIDALSKQSDKQTGIPSSDVVSPVTGQLTPSQVYEMCSPSVVGIRATVNVAAGNGQTQQAYSLGSGFILSEDGYIVTNHHVIDQAASISITTVDGQEYTAQLIGSDAANDVALLKTDATGLQPVVIGSSDATAIGDQVVAIGNPLGDLISTQTVGYISGKNRNVTTDGTSISMLQTDAAINSGNSGGPLFNMKGQVIGINTAKYSGTTSSGASIEGIGFAIPIDDVLGMLSDLKEFGYVKSGYLGVTVSDMDPAAANAYNLPNGAYIHTVEPGSCAEKGGIQPKDIVLELGGYKIGGLNDLTRALREFEPGDKISVTVFRMGRKIQLTLVLDEKPAPEQTQPQAQPETQPSTQVPSQDNIPDWFKPFYDFFNGGK